MNLEPVFSRVNLAAVYAKVSLLRLSEIADDSFHLRSVKFRCQLGLRYLIRGGGLDPGATVPNFGGINRHSVVVLLRRLKVGPERGMSNAQIFGDRRYPS